MGVAHTRNDLRELLYDFYYSLVNELIVQYSTNLLRSTTTLELRVSHLGAELSIRVPYETHEALET